MPLHLNKSVRVCVSDILGGIEVRVEVGESDRERKREKEKRENIDFGISLGTLSSCLLTHTLSYRSLAQHDKMKTNTGQRRQDEERE